MKIRFSTQAQDLIKIYSKSQKQFSGFLTGMEIGQFKLVNSLIAVNFSPQDLEKCYVEFFAYFAKNSLGLFFINQDPFKNDWLTEDLILVIKNGETNFFEYYFENKIKNHKFKKMNYER